MESQKNSRGTNFLIFVLAFQISWAISFHCCTVLSTVVATLLKTEAGKSVLSYFFFVFRWLMEAADVSSVFLLVVSLYKLPLCMCIDHVDF